MALPAVAEGVYAVPDDGNEDSCGACRGIGVLICCENCPAAFHATCAGYKDEDDIPGGEDDPWLCWSCCRDTKTPFAHTQSPSDAKVGDWVMLAVREGAITYHKAKVAAVSGGKVTLRHNDLKGTLEEVPVTSPRLWHGTLEDKAWERKHSSYMPVSRAYGIDTEQIHGSTGMNGVSSSAPAVQCAGGGAACVQTGDQKRKAPAGPEQPRKAPKLTVKLPASSAPAAKGRLPAKGLGAGLPLHRGPSLPVRLSAGASSHVTAARASKAAAQSQQDGLAGKTQGASMHSASHPAAGPSKPAGSMGGQAAVTAGPQPGGADSSAAGSWSADLPCKEKFTSAHISWLRKQGDTGERSRQYFEEAEIDMFLLWMRIVQHGGINAVSAATAWNEIGMSVGLPDTLKNKQYICRSRFKAARLDEFTQACRAGRTGIKLPPQIPLRAAPVSTNSALANPRISNPQPHQQQQQQPARPKVFLRPKAMEIPGSAVAGVPREERSPAQSLPETRPSARTADLRVVGWTEVVSDHALKPGTEVDVRPIDGPYLGGWHQAQVLETAPGSMWEGGLRVHVELQENSPSLGSTQVPKPRRWLPLVHAPANGATPAAVVRLPPKLAHLPKRWAVGERVEGLWAEEDSWWPACIHAVLPKGYLELRLEPTATHSEGEVWHVHSSLVRSAPTAGSLKHVLLHAVQDCARVMPETLRHRLAWQQHFMDEDWVLESYSTEDSMPKTPRHLSQLSARLSNSDRQPVTSSLEECLQMAAQRPPNTPNLGGKARNPAAASKPRLARLGDLARRSSQPAGAAASPDAAAAPPSSGAMPNRSSPHTSAPRADLSTDPIGEDPAPVQPGRRSHPAASKPNPPRTGPLQTPSAPLPAPLPTPGAALPAPRIQLPAPVSRPPQLGHVAAHRTLSPAPGKALAERPRPPVAKLIPMAGRTGKLNPVKSSIGSPTKQQASGGPSLPRMHVWPSKGAANGSARPGMSSGTSSSGRMHLGSDDTESREQSNGSPTHVDKITRALAPHNRSEPFKKPTPKPSVAPVSLPPLGPRVEQYQKAGGQTPPIYPRINFSIGLGPPPNQKTQPPQAPVSNAAPQQPAPSQVQRPAMMSKLVAALQFSPHFRAAPRQ